MNFWRTLKQELQNGSIVGLLYTLESLGSSPGRQGFKMLVSESGLLLGSIGGGKMEFNLVEVTRKAMLQSTVSTKHRLVHRSGQADASGLICSGEQTVAMYSLAQKDLEWVSAVLDNNGEGILLFSEKGIQFRANEKQDEQFECQISAKKWLVKEDLKHHPVLHIVGGGHVGLALSKLAPEIGFQVNVYDNRKNLNTFQANSFAKIVPVTSFENIDDFIPEGQRQFVVIMSFMFDSDKLLLSRLLPKQFKYIGMMGSQQKVNILLQQLKKEGMPQREINKLHAPIGLQIKSQTPAEIAISIMAELVGIKNA